MTFFGVVMAFSAGKHGFPKWERAFPVGEHGFPLFFRLMRGIAGINIEKKLFTN
jgi:hypothetical protein